MQTIVRNGTNISLYYLTDSKTVDITSTGTTISEGGTPELIISDCTTSDATRSEERRVGKECRSRRSRYRWQHRDKTARCGTRWHKLH